MFYRTKKANQYFLCSDDYMVIPSFDEKKCILRKIVRDKDNTFICFQCDHRTMLDNISQQSKKTSSFIHAKLCQTLCSDTQPVNLCLGKWYNVPCFSPSTIAWSRSFKQLDYKTKVSHLLREKMYSHQHLYRGSQC